MENKDVKATELNPEQLETVNGGLSHRYSFTCEKCKAVFSTQKDLQTHIDFYHSSDPHANPGSPYQPVL